ncbi:hypothetical protein Acy02nite_05020 [Actinoplanes cyaneus]|uniref:Uncharacterized protein n=1 Tax=Actinoplanes cyaneus TaxID=52696 RepID=A0A919IDZ4_9ACTN|nr:hypothetical protein Acy02nite_05020 [Actinoplanes cyaneus]
MFINVNEIHLTVKTVKDSLGQDPNPIKSPFPYVVKPTAPTRVTVSDVPPPEGHERRDQQSPGGRRQDGEPGPGI